MFLEILCWCSFFLVECFEFLYDNYTEILVLPFHIKKTLRLRNRLSKEYYNLFFQQTQHRIYKVDSRETKEISTVVTILFTSHNLISWTIRSKKDQMVVKKLTYKVFQIGRLHLQFHISALSPRYAYQNFEVVNNDLKMNNKYVNLKIIGIYPYSFIANDIAQQPNCLRRHSQFFGGILFVSM